MRLSVSPLLFLFLPLTSTSLFSFALARGGERTSSSASLTGRHLVEEGVSKPPVDLEKGYMTNDELENAVISFGERCSNISRIYSIGRSVNGFPLWVVEISDNPGKEEPEPAFKFVGNVHGDEPVGRELLILLANWLCDNYLKDPLATQIVKNIHLHMLPSMNPDGFSLKRRGNANNIDLNRDFPDQFFDMDDVVARQPETKAVMLWSQRTRFTASASLHGGALVANYPWDGTEDKRKNYFACPDDETFRYLASVYSLSHHNMSLSKEFPGGITNGASWYPIYGGMQDWNYIHCGCFELTLEISDNKWPNATELPTLWGYNRMSMLKLASAVLKNVVHGKIFASDDGRPLPASITVKGINHTVKAGKPFADYHRLLAPGAKYEVTASAQGYRSRSTLIFLEEEDANMVDFILDPETSNHVEVQRVGCDCSSNMSSFEVMDIFVKPHLEVSLLVIVALLFFCFFLRKVNLDIRKRRQISGSKRPNVV
ncbi:suppressor of los1-1 [Dionaea muscipula]